MKYGGMTVNERLFTAGLLEAFDKAISNRQRAEALRILQEVELTPTQAESTVSTIEQNPSQYGYPR